MKYTIRSRFRLLWQGILLTGLCSFGLTSGQGCRDQTQFCLVLKPLCGAANVEDYFLRNCRFSCDLCDRPSVIRWTPWSAYNECSATCGGGTQVRNRVCENGSFFLRCLGPPQESRPCATDECIEESVWAAWSSCSATCGRGFRTRTRSCGEYCVNYDHEECQSENRENCRCSSCECKDDQRYIPYCTVRVAKDRTRWCQGRTLTACRKSCGACEDCAICPPVYGEWGKWSDCSLACGGGVRFRFRNCNLIGGCRGTYWDSEFCNTQDCEASVEPHNQCRQENVCTELVELQASFRFETIQSPGHPLSYPSDLICEWRINALTGERIELSFDSIDVDVCIDSLVLYDFPESGGIIQVTQYSALFVTGRNYQSMSSSIQIYFSSTAKCSNRTGFQIAYRSVDAESVSVPGELRRGACGFNVTASETSQEITSPLFPQTYGNFQYCEWYLYARPGREIVLEFDFVETEKCCDGLKVYDGNNLVKELKGIHFDVSNIYSTGGALKLVFTSDSTEDSAGFVGSFYDISENAVPAPPTQDPSCECGFNLEATSEPQNFSSPNWPDLYCNNAECEWNVFASADSVIRFDFTDLALEACCDSLEISEPDGRVQVLRGYDGSRRIYSFGNRVLVKFRSDQTAAFEGFNVLVSEVQVVPGKDSQVLIDNACSITSATVFPKPADTFNAADDARALQRAFSRKIDGGRNYPEIFEIISRRSLNQRLEIAEAYKDVSLTLGGTIFLDIKTHFRDSIYFRDLLVALFTPDLEYETERLRFAFRGATNILKDILNNNAASAALMKAVTTAKEKGVVTLTGLPEIVVSLLKIEPIEDICDAIEKGANSINEVLEELGTNEATLLQVILCRSSAELAQIDQRYRRSNNPTFNNILTDVFGDTCGDHEAFLTKLIKSKLSSDPVPTPNLNEATEAARGLRRAIDNGLFGWSTDEDAFFCLVTNRNPEQLRLIFEIYQQITDKDIMQSIRGDFSGDVREALFSLVESTRCKPAYLARLLHEALTGLLVDELTLTGIIVTRSEIDMAQIKEKYKQMYRSTLEDELESAGSLDGDYKRMLIELIEDK